MTERCVSFKVLRKQSRLLPNSCAQTHFCDEIMISVKFGLIYGATIFTLHNYNAKSRIKILKPFFLVKIKCSLANHSIGLSMASFSNVALVEDDKNTFRFALVWLLNRRRPWKIGIMWGELHFEVSWANGFSGHCWSWSKRSMFTMGWWEQFWPSFQLESSY